MHFIEPINRAQVTFGSLEDLMTPDNPVRLIDAFADRLDLKRLAFGVNVKAPRKRKCLMNCAQTLKMELGIWQDHPGFIPNRPYSLKNDDADECS